MVTCPLNPWERIKENHPTTKPEPAPEYTIAVIIRIHVPAGTTLGELATLIPYDAEIVG